MLPLDSHCRCQQYRHATQVTQPHHQHQHYHNLIININILTIWPYMVISRLDHHLILSLSFPPWPGCRLVRPPEFSSRYQIKYQMVPSTGYLVVPGAPPLVTKVLFLQVPPLRAGKSLDWRSQVCCFQNYPLHRYQAHKPHRPLAGGSM